MKNLNYSVILNYTLAVLLVLSIGAGVVQRCSSVPKDDYNLLKKELSDSVHAFKTSQFIYNNKIATQEQVITNLKAATDAQLLEMKELKALNMKQLQSIVSFKEEINRYKVSVPFEPVSFPTLPTDTGTYYPETRIFRYADPWTFLKGKVNISGLILDTLKMYTYPTVYLGYQAKGWFRSTPIVAVQDRNPYVSIVTMDNVVITKKIPFYQRPWFYMSTGAAGVIVVKVLLNTLR